MRKKPVETIMGLVVLVVALLFLIFAYRVSDLQVVKGYTLTADFMDPNLTEVYRKALQLPKLPGKLFHSTGQMTSEYLSLYQEFLPE